MKLPAALLAAGLATAGLAAEPAPRETDDRPALLLVGDSTLATRTGYGDALCERLGPGYACLNLARGGRSTASYRAEGLWGGVLAQLQARPTAGQHLVLIQFGHNDQPGKPGRSTDLATEFPANLARYVQDVRAAGAVPLLATPLTRRSFREGQLNNDLQPWADSVRRVAAELNVPPLDLNRISAQAVQAMGPAEADLLATAPPPPPGQPASGASAGFDRTHLGARGACVFAEQMAAEMARQVPALAQALRPGPDCSSVPPPGPVPVPAATPPAPQPVVQPRPAGAESR